MSKVNDAIFHPNPCPKVIRVLVSKPMRGNGTEGSPYRTVTMLHSLDGRLLCEWDPAREDGAVASHLADPEER